ncbi:hypothetical protein IQ247_09415 [Plectonema cf. radiosum LEGE 06105]|uniref:Uncharacterized protein n=1 Tax=Plectonema cf. radiosum LEGE 06105 TaxID=945769 RepID=A0A8J7K2C6_9CYAN|nr:hypothetical protein [Plectonema radiosum]MBE9212907.1 hypothetical protein [Plectonema cf. radiosum LEGE 06105]
MKTVEELKSRIKEISSECVDCAKRGNELIHAGNREEGSKLMWQAFRASKRCQALYAELVRREKLEQAS